MASKSAHSFVHRSVEEYQQARIASFDHLKERVKWLNSLLADAKKATKAYYAENPKSWASVYVTDDMLERVESIIEDLDPQP